MSDLSITLGDRTFPLERIDDANFRVIEEGEGAIDIFSEVFDSLNWATIHFHGPRDGFLWKLALERCVPL